MLDAYAAGVNAFLATTTALPVEYQLLGQRPEPWESWHCLAVYKMRNSLLGTFESKLWRTRLAQGVGPENLAQLIKGYPQGHLLTVPPGTEYQGEPLDGLAALSRETDPGSNAWSIAGEYTDSGLPLVAGDSHRALSTPLPSITKSISPARTSPSAATQCPASPALCTFATTSTWLGA